RSVAFVFVCALVAVSIARPASALSCLPVNLSDHIERAHVIFTGTVGDTSGEWAIVDVDRYYKGSGPAKVTVKTDGTWGPFLTPGEQCLLFVTVDEKQVWDLGLCGASRQISAGQPLTQAETDLLGTGTEPDAGADGPKSRQPAWLLWGAGAVAAGLIAFGA